MKFNVEIFGLRDITEQRGRDHAGDLLPRQDSGAVLLLRRQCAPPGQPSAQLLGIVTLVGLEAEPVEAELPAIAPVESLRAGYTEGEGACRRIEEVLGLAEALSDNLGGMEAAAHPAVIMQGAARR